jgi:hypothetical protein
MEEKYKIHAFYVLLILVSIIIILVTVQWSAIPNLSEKLSFALTLASLILAALAIGYAVYSNTTISQSISTLNQVSNDVSETAKDISVAADNLSQVIEAIPTRLDSMEGKVDQTNILLQQYSEKGDTQPLSEGEKSAASGIVDLFIDKIPPAGLLILYAYFLAYSQKKLFKLKELIPILNISDYSYAHGFVMATKSIGLISSEKSGMATKVTYMHEKLGQYLSTQLDQRINNLPNEYNYDKERFEAAINDLRSDKKQIEQYFEAISDTFQSAT